MKKFLSLFLVIFGINALDNLSVCTIIKNEGAHLREWVEYHRLIGVDHFYLYNLESTDSYDSVLKPYIEQKIVTLVEWPNLGSSDPNLKMLSNQIPAYENATKYLAAKKTKWLAIIDVDEFLVPPSECTLEDLLQSCSEFSAITLTTQCYDATVIDSEKKLILESTNLTNPSVDKKIAKTIFRPEDVLGFTYPPYKPILAAGKKEMGSITINHYANRLTPYLFNGSYKESLIVDSKQLKAGEKEFLMEKYQLRDLSAPILRYAPAVHHSLSQ